MTVASSLAPTAVHHNSLNDLVAVCRKHQVGTFIDGKMELAPIRKITQYYCNTGGSLLLANEGVCTITNLSSYKKDTKEILQKGMSLYNLLYIYSLNQPGVN